MNINEIKHYETEKTNIYILEENKYDLGFSTTVKRKPTRQLQLEVAKAPQT